MIILTKLRFDWYLVIFKALEFVMIRVVRNLIEKARWAEIDGAWNALPSDAHNFLGTTFDTSARVIKMLHSSRSVVDHLLF